MFWLGVLIGMFVGTMLGFLAAGLLGMLARQGSEDYELPDVADRSPLQRQERNCRECG
jgi:uncharacterized membrane-anchored protein YhcB (DUF1043 family)